MASASIPIAGYTDPLMEEQLKRPARRQVEESQIVHEEKRDLNTHNIWYGKKMDHGTERKFGADRREAMVRSKYRCVPQLDCGRTRGSDANQHVFCIYFAKGCCAQGSACPYLHRLPNAADEAHSATDFGADIFNREKRTEENGFVKGAGTLERDNRTLYVLYEGAGSYDLPKVRQLIEANFAAWGEIESIYIVHAKTIAFVKYKWRTSAEFAKEAMHKQGLLGSTQREVLTVRWAREDPNPTVVVATKRKYVDAFTQAQLANWDALPEEQRKARIQQLQMATALKNKNAIAYYPNTDDQYRQTSYPNTDGAYPDTDAAYPDTGAAYPDTDGAYPDAAAAYPNTDAAYPYTDAAYPSTVPSVYGAAGTAPAKQYTGIREFEVAIWGEDNSADAAGPSGAAAQQQGGAAAYGQQQQQQQQEEVDEVAEAEAAWLASLQGYGDGDGDDDDSGGAGSGAVGGEGGARAGASTAPQEGALGGGAAATSAGANPSTTAAAAGSTGSRDPAALPVSTTGYGAHAAAPSGYGAPRQTH